MLFDVNNIEEESLPTEATEIAREPEEEACLSQTQDINTLQPEDCTDPMNKPKTITFAEATQSSQNSTSTYKDALSQPAPTLSHRQRLLWLQQRRAPGLWAQCDDCDKWRFLPDVIDAHELPAKWYCRMNPDKTLSECSTPEKPLRLREEDDLVHGVYSAGSVVWARLAGWPWWPAMVDDCPDTEQYYWLDGFSDIPTHYNVVFFDASDVTRAWIAPENLQPFGPNKKFHKTLPRAKSQRQRMEIAIRQADNAEKLPLKQRLAKYSFISRYPGKINSPKKITKHELVRFQNILKRKYNIDFPDDDSTDEDDEYQPANEKTTVIKKRNNVLLVGTPKSKRKSRTTSENKKGSNLKTRIEDSFLETEADSQKTKCDSELTVENVQENNMITVNDAFKQPNSMAVQVGSTVTSTVVDDTVDNVDNDTSATYVPENDSGNEVIQDTIKNIRTREMSCSSDDFDF